MNTLLDKSNYSVGHLCFEHKPIPYEDSISLFAFYHEPIAYEDSLTNQSRSLIVDRQKYLLPFWHKGFVYGKKHTKGLLDSKCICQSSVNNYQLIMHDTLSSFDTPLRQSSLLSYTDLML